MIKRLTSLLFGLAAAACAVWGQTATYSTSSTDIKVGILVTADPANPGLLTSASPYTWQAMDQDTRVKPAGWSFVNPYAPGTWTADLISRDPANPYVQPLGTKVTKSDYVYWEVDLAHLTPSQASNYDVLMLPEKGLLTLTPNERETLRNFVDAGGVLWADFVPGSFVDGTNSLPLTFLVANSVSSTFNADLTSSILTTPNPLTPTDVAQLTPVASGHQILTSYNLGGADSLLLGDTAKFQPVVTDSNGVVDAVAPYGSGFIVATAQGVSTNLTAVAGAGNAPFLQRFALDQHQISAAKFVVNLVDLAGAFSRPSGTSRGLSSQRAGVTAPMLSSFNAPGSFVPPAGPAQAPGYLHGRVVVRDGTDLVCYLANPQQASVPSLSAGGAVQLWRVQALGDFSSPLVVNAPDGAADGSGVTHPDQVWVSLPDGEGFVYAMDSTGLNPAPLTHWAAGSLPTFTGGGALSPVLYGNDVYFTGDQTLSSPAIAAVGVVDVRSRALVTASPFNLNIGTTVYGPSASPTVGLVPLSDGSGGSDAVMYMPTAPTSDHSTSPAGLASVWLGARSELDPAQVSGTVVTIMTRAGLAGNLPVTNVRVVPVAAGVPLNSAQFNADVVSASGNSNGQIQIVLTAPGVGGFGWDGTGANPITWRVDYDIDWSNITTKNPVRGYVTFPDRTPFNSVVVGSPAMSPDGHLAVLVSSPVAPFGGNYYNIQEVQNGTFFFDSCFTLYDAVNTFQVAVPSVTTPTTLPGAFQDFDDLTNQMLPALTGNAIQAGAVSQLQFVGGPSYRDGTFYAVASGKENSNGLPIDIGVLMSFKASPSPATFQVKGIQAPGAVAIVPNVSQPNLANSVDPTNPNPGNPTTVSYPSSPVAGQPVTMSISPAPTNDGLTYGTLTIYNLASSSNGKIQGVLSQNLPLFYNAPGVNTPLGIQPESGQTWSYGGSSMTFSPGSAGGTFNPLNYYQINFGYKPSTTPLVAGQTLFLGGESVLPSILQTPFSGIAYSGLLSAEDTQVSQGDPFIKANANEVWMSQLVSAVGSSITSGTFNTHSLWPNFAGVQSLEDLRIKVQQATVPDDHVSSLASSGDGVLALSNTTATAVGNLTAFSPVNILVADQGRVGRYDATGNPIWTMVGTLQAGTDVPRVNSSKVRPLSDPVRVFPASSGGVWVVDRGANAVVQVDNSGLELRRIERAKIDPQLSTSVFSGLRAGEPLTLKGPRDALGFTTLMTPSQVASIFPGEVQQATPVSVVGEQWLHTVIADAGNDRVIELVDRQWINSDGTVFGPVRYQVNANSPDNEGDGYTTAYGVMVWHTPAQFSGQGFSYAALDRLQVNWSGAAQSVYAFGFNNVEAGSSTFPGVAIDNTDNTAGTFNANSGNGGIVVYDGANTEVIHEFVMPAATSGYLQNNGAGIFGYVSQAQQTLHISGLRSVKARYVLDPGSVTPTLALMVAMDRGVFEIEETATKGIWAVRWMLPSEAYSTMRHAGGPVTSTYLTTDLANNPVGFNPSYAERLASGDVIVVNSATGNYMGGASFGGEVDLIDGTVVPNSSLATWPSTVPGYNPTLPDLGFNVLAVKYQIPSAPGSNSKVGRDIFRPVFATRQ